ncbi:MAG TPA: hypothetical protein VL475_01050 [Planctomycetaceae bacterium]|nr:hypothetical protein [Planctomycetaceae bacterium]
MELQDALVQVSEIRRQMARSETFRGYRSVPAAISAAIAVGTAALQPAIVADPAASPERYLKLWVSAAFVSILVTAGEMVVRCRRSASPLTTRMALLMVEQFLPCTIVGGAVTLVLSLGESEGLWMLPGLWGLFFSLGLFASARLLPRPIFAVALYYLACGLAALAFAHGDRAFSPWTMATTFGGGQLMTAIILYFTLERPHGNA